MAWLTIEQIKSTHLDECAICGQPAANSGWITIEHTDFPFKQTKIFHTECIDREGQDDE